MSRNCNFNGANHQQEPASDPAPLDQPDWRAAAMRDHRDRPGPVIRTDAAIVFDRRRRNRRRQDHRLLQRYDPDGRARGFSLDAAAQRLTLQAPNAPAIDLVTGEATAAPAARDGLFQWARRTHERLLGQPWLVTASTCAMVVIMALGILMGWPRLRHSLAGWHKGAAWFSLPLILLSPLTGLCMAFGLSFQVDPDLGHAARPLGLPEAVRRVAQSHDLAQVGSIGIRGGRMMARIFEGGELRAYALTADGLTALPRNWPRALHEGNWSASPAARSTWRFRLCCLGCCRPASCCGGGDSCAGRGAGAAKRQCGPGWRKGGFIGAPATGKSSLLLPSFRFIIRRRSRPHSAWLELNRRSSPVETRWSAVRRHRRQIDQAGGCIWVRQTGAIKKDDTLRKVPHDVARLAR